MQVVCDMVHVVFLVYLLGVDSRLLHVNHIFWFGCVVPFKIFMYYVLYVC